MNLANFTLPVPALATQNPLFTTLLLVGGAVVASLVVEHLARTLDVGRYAWQRRLRTRMGVAVGARIHELKWLTLSYQVVLWPFIGFLLLHVWGQHEVGESVSNALTGEGFTVGSAHVVPVKILFGVLWFVLLVTFTRWLKAKLEEDWLPLSQLEASVRVSVATLFGYITFIIATMVGLSVAGLDLSKLAIVAGALSVGIGFGLQNIVNNFVSGLILLFERPVRLGDYIKVGGIEGFVRRIRIRSTELETWDRTTVIVPNSELLSSKVENSTYGDTLGRVILPVNVSNNNDPEQVKALLLAVAEASPQLINDRADYGIPKPSVIFKDFGDANLSFELRGYVGDINTRLGVASELRFAVLKTLREHGISLPKPPATPAPAEPAH